MSRKRARRSSTAAGPVTPHRCTNGRSRPPPAASPSWPTAPPVRTSSASWRRSPPPFVGTRRSVGEKGRRLRRLVLDEPRREGGGRDRLAPVEALAVLAAERE